MEEKITSLITSNKYHSAIFFAYCVDIRFLDQVVIPQLKRKGIINFLCFVDSQMINKSIEWISHGELKNKETYYLSAVESKGAFHPKLLALFGENNIHLNIGSGNLTYTGYGGNKENWLSFIFDNNNNSDAKILSEIWNYISLTTMMYNGVAKTKIGWIKDNCLLLNNLDILKNRNEFISIDNDRSVLFLDNNYESIFSKIKNAITEKIKIVNMHSPFYDSDLESLNDLLSFFHPNFINLYVQPEYTNISKESFIKLPPSVNFFKLDESNYNHSKQIEFVSDNSIYFMMGSPNLSRAAIGSSKTSPINNEFGVLIKSKNNYFNDLNVESSQIDKSILEAQLKSRYEIQKKNKGNDKCKYSIMNIEEYLDEFIVYTLYDVPNDIYLVIENNKGELLEKLKSSKVENIEKCFKVNYHSKSKLKSGLLIGYLVDSDNIVSSNKLIIHNTLLQLKSNPDKKRRKLQEILFKLEDGIGNVTELYKFIDPIQILNTSKYKREIKHTIGLDEKILEPENDSAITLSYDDFKKSEEYEIKVNGHYYTDKALLSNIFKILNELIEGITGHNHVEEGDEEESVDPETTQGEVRNDKVVSDSTEELKYSEIERLEKVTLNFFTKYVNKLQKNIEVGKKIDSTIVNPLLFSVSAIFNSLLINNVLNLTSNSTLKPISILKMEDYVEIGTSMIGGIYNFKSRKSFISKDVYEKDTFIQNGLKYSFLSTAFILSSIRSLNSKILLQLDNSYKMLFYNAVDISRRNNYIPTRNDFEEYLSKLLNNSKNSHIFDEKKVMDNFEILFASYDKIFITKEPLKIKDINNFNIYFSELFGFVMPINLIRSNEKVDFAYYIPGIYGECESKRLHYGTNIGRAAGWKEIKYKSLKSSQL